MRSVHSNCLRLHSIEREQAGSRWMVRGQLCSWERSNRAGSQISFRPSALLSSDVEVVELLSVASRLWRGVNRSGPSRPLALLLDASRRRVCQPGYVVALFLLSLAGPARAETLPEALVRTYQGNPVLNAERARLRGIDETVPRAVAPCRPQIMALLTGGLQAVRVLFPDNTVQTATLRTWTIGLTVSQTLFNGVKTANTVRQSEANVRSGREALRNVGQGVLLDAVTAYTNVLANQTLVEAQRINSTFLREVLGTTRKRLDAGDVTPTDVAQAEARQSRGLADLNAAEVNLAISQAIYAQVTGAPPGRLAPAEPVDRLLPRTREEAVAINRKDHPALMAEM